MPLLDWLPNLTAYKLPIFAASCRGLAVGRNNLIFRQSCFGCPLISYGSACEVARREKAKPRVVLAPIPSSARARCGSCGQVRLLCL